MICRGGKEGEEGGREVDDDLGEYCGELLGLVRSGSIGGTWELVRERTRYDMCSSTLVVTGCLLLPTQHKTQKSVDTGENSFS